MARKTMAASAAQELFTTLLSAGTAFLRTPPDRPPTVHRCVPPTSRLAGPGARRTTLVVDVDGALLRRSRSPFPYFMLVALEAGGFLRGLALLLLYPFISCLFGVGGGDWTVRAMAAVAFCGLRAGTFRAGRAVLPRWLLEDATAEALQVARRAADPARMVWASAMPRVMVEPFLREYLQVPPAAVVAARETKTVWGFYTGVLAEDVAGGKLISELRKKKKAAGGCDDDIDVVGFSGGSMEFVRRPVASICKEMSVVSDAEQSKWRRLPRHEYPRPLVFHDGRLAFLPTPLAVTAMFMWLRLGGALALFRLAVALALPYRYATAIHAATGHTFREPFLLRFSPLFAELGGDSGVVPVALAVETSMFYSTTAGGWKGVDPFYFLSNPRMCYTVQFLDRVDTSPVREGKVASTDVANRVQRMLAAALGYACTMLTRKDKYLLLAGNNGKK